ncbi:MAG: PD-(D/E)XK nuclease family protein [Acidobacteria bacterium]|nr:PD-(D/E)XK nuclease family protein [Acidobacteriota bacterium]
MSLPAEARLPVTDASREAALETLEEVVATEAASQYEQLAPAIDRVWHDEMAAIRRDLRLWVGEVAKAGGEWVPLYFEWGFGLRDDGRDPASAPEPVTVAERFLLRGSIDLVEERAGTGELRITDHKTGKCRVGERLIVGGGRVLQPTIYSLALQAATGRPVVEGRLFYTTIAGGFRQIPVPMTDTARRAAVEVLEIIDRAIEHGFLVPAPREKACGWCDFRPVCGPALQGRRKSLEELADLNALRSMP